MFWITFHNIFRAGVTLLDCFSHSPEVREQISLREVERSIHACSAVMWGMVERFPAAKVKRDAFEAFASVSLDSAAALVAANSTAPSERSSISNGPNNLPGWPTWNASTTLIGDEVPAANYETGVTTAANELSTDLSSYWMPGSESFFNGDGQIRPWNDPDIEWMNSGPNPTFFSNVI
jgi:hypothetical protein